MAKLKKKSQLHEVYGRPRWVRGFPSNRDKNGPEGAEWGEKFDGMYVCDFILDKENYAVFKATGSQWKVYKGSDEDDAEKFDLKPGEYLIKPRRPHRNPSGFENYGGPPTIGLVDGTIISEEDGFGVGNGSSGFLTFSTYPTSIGIGTRWETLELDEWEKYPLANTKAVIKNRNLEVKVTEASDDDDDDEEEVEVVQRTPKPKQRAVKNEDLDDEIPL